MSQPPPSPHGADDPTRRLGPPGQREATRRLDQPAPYGPPGQYGPPPFGPPPYGPAQYGPAQYGPAPFGPPWAPPGTLPTKNRKLTIALVIAAVVVLAAGGVALWLLLGRGDDGPGSLPPATTTPDGLGADPLLDAYALDCYEGSMVACDELFIEARAGSSYEDYGDTCAGRQPPGTNVYCTVSFPEG